MYPDVEGQREKEGWRGLEHGTRARRDEEVTSGL